MSYNFDLRADDYIEMSISSYTLTHVVRSSVPQALCAALVAWIAAHHLFGTTLAIASVLGALVFAGDLSYHGLSWRRNYVKALSRFYDEPEQRAIQGPHTLELSDEGLNSCGPLHRSFRAWPSITHVSLTQSHLLFYTTFGNVYVLPLRAVEDRESLMAKLRDKHAIKVQAVSA